MPDVHPMRGMHPMPKYRPDHYPDQTIKRAADTLREANPELREGEAILLAIAADPARYTAYRAMWPDLESGGGARTSELNAFDSGGTIWFCNVRLASRLDFWHRRGSAAESRFGVNACGTFDRLHEVTL